MFYSKLLLPAILLQSLYFTNVGSTGAIFPLYIFPGDPGICAGWSAVLDSISANPTLPFYLIVNPNSGPVDTPDPGYQSCIPQVRSLSDNVKVVGYVATGYGSKASSDVLNEVTTYMNWDVSYRPTGIFFDETNATADHVQLYTSYAAQVRQDVPGDSFVILNPGIPVSVDDYFTISDMIVTTETFFDDFDPASLEISGTKPASKQAVILHTGPQPFPLPSSMRWLASD
ncbi:hypothetical protein D9758_011086 [Tetrapyrgos nigripes]|uniref:Spherulation-specific family 4 n=1 Tax=Tetrapyrgos nigripes TaxID=182062 RepID=A0A8H5CSV2_9AGAR|nr:hypothetical protein D9758_011086 [Tetrapyrgos nigripes]